MRFIGFRANLDTILIGIEERFGRGPSADKLAGVLSTPTGER